MAMPDNKSSEPPAPQLQPNQLHTIYVNGFDIGLGNCDVSVILQNNGKPLFLMNLSYTFAKTLAQELSHIVEHLEKASGRPIMTAMETASFLTKTIEAPK